MSSVFDKYKPTSTASVKKLSEAEDAATNFNKRSGRLELVDGENKIRIGPRHPGEESFMHIHGCHWITVPKDDGELGRRTVPNARLHAGVKIDPVEAYVDFCKVKLSTGEANDSEKLKILTDYKTGLNLSTTWVSYGKKIKGTERGPWEIFEYKKTVRDAMKNAMITEDEDEAIEVDPLTDPLTGVCILVTYNSKAKKGTDFYKVKLGTKETPITEEEMIAYDKLTPISKLSDLSYTMKDYELAIEGLKHYDEEHEIDLFEDEEFQANLLNIKKTIKATVGGDMATTKSVKEDSVDDMSFDEDEPKSTKSAKKLEPKKPAKATPVKPVERDEDEQDEEEAEAENNEEEDSLEEFTDKFTDMDRKALVAYKASKGYEIKLLKNDDDDAIRTKLREYEAANSTDEGEEAEEDAEVETVVAKKAPPKSSGKSSLTLEEIKAKMNKQKGK